MLPVAGRPFLEHLLRYLGRQGVRRAVLCVGHRGAAIRAHFRDGDAVGLSLVYSEERELLGTGGALRQAVSLVTGGTVVALNGDSFVRLDLPAMLARHLSPPAPATVALVRVSDTSRFGAVQLEEAGSRITRFGEKSAVGPGLINAGVYLLQRKEIERIPAGVVSFEHDVLPGLAARGARGFITQGLFADIGTPEDYGRLAAAPGRLLAAVTA
jgi:NDP-sugar pyrophosphorylase family protein